MHENDLASEDQSVKNNGIALSFNMAWVIGEMGG